MRGINCWLRWMLVVVVLLVVSALDAPNALATDGSCVTCSPETPPAAPPAADTSGSTISARIPAKQYVNVSTNGKTVHVTTPRVLPPCYYVLQGSGKEMAEKIQDPGSGIIGDLTDLIDSLLVQLTYDEAQTAKDATDQFWWKPSCTWMDGLVGLDATPSEQALAEYKTQWAQSHGAWVLRPEADPPVVQVPRRVLAALAEADARKQVTMPRLEFSPAAGLPTFVTLATGVWAVPDGWSRVTATAQQGDLSASVWADPVGMTFTGQPAGSEVTPCTDGGSPYQPGGGDPTCFIRFSQSSGQEPGQVWPVTITVTWQIGADVPLGGEPAILTQQTHDFQVQEVQTVNNGNLRAPATTR